MRIAQFIGKCGPGGAETIALALAKELAEVPIIDSVVYTTEVVDPDWTYAQLGSSPVQVIQLSPDVMKYWSIKNILQFSYAFNKVLRRDGITHLHSHMYPQILRGAGAAKMAGISNVGTLHDVYSLLDKPARIRWLKFATMLGTQLVSVSKDMNDTYHNVSRDYRFCKLPDDNPQIVYNGVDTYTYYPRDCRRVYDFELISVGRLAEVKNFEMLIKAMGRLKTVGKSVHLRLVGDGPQRARLEQVAMEEGVDHMITFLGSCDNVPELLCSADLFVLPSLSEGLSCSILEAMASGLPILATDVGGNKELVQFNGKLIPSNNAALMAEAIDEMIWNKYNTIELSAMGKRSLSMVHELFSFDNMVDSYIGLYGNVLDS